MTITPTALEIEQSRKITSLETQLERARDDLHACLLELEQTHSSAMETHRHRYI
jgi:hypothetical protein